MIELYGNLDVCTTDGTGPSGSEDTKSVTVGDTKAAEIMKAVMSGKSVTAAYHDIAGVDLPPRAPRSPTRSPHPSCSPPTWRGSRTANR